MYDTSWNAWIPKLRRNMDLYSYVATAQEVLRKYDLDVSLWSPLPGTQVAGGRAQSPPIWKERSYMVSSTKKRQRTIVTENPHTHGYRRAGSNLRQRA